MKKVLVTGGLGFVGSNLVKQLVESYNCNVTIIDDCFTGSMNNIKNIKSAKVQFVKGTVLNKELIEKHVKGKDAVFHLAARNIIVSSAKPEEDMSVNIKGSFNVFDACLKHKAKRVVYTSTSSIYGNARYLPIDEDNAPVFLNNYSVSKYGGEAYAKVFYEQHNLPVSIVRYSNVYGYNQHPSNPYCGVIGKFIQNALLNLPVRIHGDGQQTRDFTFVEDACNATIAAAIDPKAIGEVFNIGSGVETSVNDLASVIISISNSSSAIEYVDKRDIDNIRRRVLNVEKIRQRLRFFPRYNLRKGLENTIEWFKKNEMGKK